MSPIANNGMIPPGGFTPGWLARGPDEAPCHGLCPRGGHCDPVPTRPVSWDGMALCQRFCRGFAARRNSIVVRRPRNRSARRADRETVQ